MPLVTQLFDPIALIGRLRVAHVVTRPLMQDILDRGCRRFPSFGQSERTARLKRLVDATPKAPAPDEPVVAFDALGATHGLTVDAGGAGVIPGTACGANAFSSAASCSR